MEGSLYKTEHHCHTLDASPCSSLSAEQLVELYTKSNYDSVVIANHFSRRYMKQYGISTYKEYVEFIQKHAPDKLIEAKRTATERSRSPKPTKNIHHQWTK